LPKLYQTHAITHEERRITAVDISVVTGGAKRVAVDELDKLYDVDTYRPRIRTAQGKPMFLY
jgi:hypothetical protein